MIRDNKNWLALGGILVVLTGVISLLDAWDVFEWSSWDNLWPLLLIVLGLWLVWDGLRGYFNHKPSL